MEIEIDALRERVRLRRGLPTPAVRRHIREAAGVSQAEIAAVVGVDRAAVARWEAGDRTPRQPHLDRYAAVLQELAREVLQ